MCAINVLCFLENISFLTFGETFFGGAGHVSNSGRLDIFCCTLPDITIPPTAENGSIRDDFPHNVFNYYFA